MPATVNKIIVPAKIGTAVYEKLKRYGYEIGTDNLSTAMEDILNLYLSEPCIKPDEPLPDWFNDMSRNTSFSLTVPLHDSLIEYAEASNAKVLRVLKTALYQILYTE